MKTLITLLAAAIAAFSIACGGAANTGSNANNSAAKAPVNASTPANTAAAPQDALAPVGSLATPSDAYRTAYALREKKDVAGLKRVLSKDAIEFLTEIGKAENKTLDDTVAQMFEKPQAKTVEVRNEKIDGDHATVEYKDETGAWKTMDFAKEGGEWKMSLPKFSPEDLEIETSPKPKGK